MVEKRQATEKPARNAVVRSSVVMVGLGNWGSSLAQAVRKSDWSLREVVVRRRSGRRTALLVRNWSEAALDAELIWLCVPDDAIEVACAELVRRRPDLRGQMVVHSSGARTAEALETARLSGARVAAAHPVMTFPGRGVVPLKGVLFGVEAEQPACRTRLKQVVRALGGEPFVISAENKALYHAAGTMASPLLVSAMAAAQEMAQLAGLSHEVATKMTAALAGATLKNVQQRGAAKSFSGPLARGDAGTIRLHLEALQEHPVLAGVYRALASHALESLPVNHRELVAALLEPGSK